MLVLIDRVIGSFQVRVYIKIRMYVATYIHTTGIQRPLIFIYD